MRKKLLCLLLAFLLLCSFSVFASAEALAGDVTFTAGAKMVEVMPLMSLDEQKSFFLASNTLSGQNKLQVFVFGNDEQILLCARLDNLGKGASGAAVQCLNIMMGIDETTGLV